MPRILLANDDADLLEVCQQVLESAGHSVRVVAGTTHALQEASRFHPDVIVVDMRMPDMDGLAVIRGLRSAPDTAAIPILLMSGTETARESAAEAGANAFLAKPFSAHALIAGVNGLVGQGTARGGDRGL